VTHNPKNSCLTLPVLSGSMLPCLRPGGRVCIECAGSARARAGDIIVFREADRLIAHRLLVRLSLGRRSYLFQMGDAAGMGYWVQEKQVVGVVTMSTDTDGTLLYVRSSNNRAARRSILAPIIRAFLAPARSVLRTLIADGSEKRQRLVSRSREDHGEYRICIGAVTLGLRMMPQHYRTLLSGYFGRPSAKEEPDIHLTIRVTRQESMSLLPDSLYFDKEVTSAGFTLADRLVRGRQLPGEAGVELRVPCTLLCGHAIRIFEHLIHQAFHMAARTRGEDCCLIHSAGIVRNGAGYLFVGASGSGKSTIARLSKGEQVLNDEICMVSLADTSPCLHGTPFNGFFKGKIEGQAPLKALFLLSQRESHRLMPVTMSEAVAAVFQQIVPPVGLDESVGKAAFEHMLDAAGRLLCSVPAYRLEFRQDAEFWRLIDGITQKGNPS
jgi:hypothetical protein